MPFRSSFDKMQSEIAAVYSSACILKNNPESLLQTVRTYDTIHTSNTSCVWSASTGFEPVKDRTMNYLRNIEIESHASDGYVNLLTKSASTPIAFEILEGYVMANMTEFHEFCERDDVSLSPAERDSLLSSIEAEIADTYEKADTIELAKVVDGEYQDAGSFGTIEEAKASLNSDGDYVASRGDNRFQWGFRVVDGEVTDMQPEMM